MKFKIGDSVVLNISSPGLAQGTKAIITAFAATPNDYVLRPEGNMSPYQYAVNENKIDHLITGSAIGDGGGREEPQENFNFKVGDMVKIYRNRDNPSNLNHIGAISVITRINGLTAYLKDGGLGSWSFYNLKLTSLGVKENKQAELLQQAQGLANTLEEIKLNIQTI